jgi:protein gp37
MILTKRPKIMLDFFGSDFWKVAQLPNVWLGVSVEDQCTANERIPLLLKTPAAVRFVSVEPMIEPVNMVRYLAPWGYNWDYETRGPDRINWVICGCESGPGARPMDLNWARDLRDECKLAEIPFFLKQATIDGKLIKQPELDGVKWMQFPEGK